MCFTIRQEDKVTIVRQLLIKSVLRPFTQVSGVHIKSGICIITSKIQTLNTLEHVLTFTIVNLSKVDRLIRKLRIIRDFEVSEINSIRSDKKILIFKSHHTSISIFDSTRQAKYIRLYLGKLLSNSRTIIIPSIWLL